METLLTWHIMLSTITLVLLGLSALQAILVACLEWQLGRIGRARQMPISFLPPLEVLEKRLFRLLIVVLLSLTVLLLSSLPLLFYVSASHLTSKIWASCIAWITILILLLGRHIKGWRGPKIIYATLISFIWIAVIYAVSYRWVV